METKKTLISIIVPVYNTEKYIERCLDSIMKQDYPNFEVILVNDGSTDESGIIIQKYKEKYKNISYIKQENKGVGAARNAGIKVAKGDYISFVDSDDLIMEDYCSHLLSIIGDADIAVAGREKYIDNVYDKSKTPSQVITVSGMEALKFQMLGKYNTRPAWGKLYKRNIVEDVSFVEDCIFEEVRYSAETFLKAEKVIFANKDLYSYRIRPNSIMTSNEQKRVKELVIALIYVYKILLEDGRYCECKREFEMWLVHTIIQNTQIYCEQAVDTKVFKKYVGELVKLYYKGDI